MIFECTRNSNIKYPAVEAIIKGLSDDGGLFVPCSFPKVDLSEIISMKSYQEVAEHIIGMFFDELSADEIKDCVNSAYGERFTDREIAPLKVFQKHSYLELYHGPTLAFKDMALTIMPHLLSKSLKKNNFNGNILILTATSGDTGKAALEGFKDVEGVKISVFFPENGVSDIQKLQMRTQEGKNVRVAGITGNFDDAQTGVKNIFNDSSFAEEAKSKNTILSSANSINIGRLIPQIVYYFNSYRKLVNGNIVKMNEKVNFCVPTGNFGNILAGFYAKQMGLPVNRLICASNENNVLYNFFKDGKYDRNRELHLTTSPSMDILISSNLERLLYEVSGRDSKKVAELMLKLNSDGVYSIDDDMFGKLEDFDSYFVDEDEVGRIIKNTYSENGYVIDTHTAVAKGAYDKYREKTGDDTHTVILSTASPFKFAADVYSSLENMSESEAEKLKSDVSPFEINRLLGEKYSLEIPESIIRLEKMPVRHFKTIDKNDMKNFCRDFLNNKIIIRVPATSANIGPGFDSLGLALEKYNEFTFEKTDSGLEITGCEDEFRNEDNLVYRSYRYVYEKFSITDRIKGLKLNIDNDVPVCRGLGSSATCIVAGVMAAGIFENLNLSEKQIIEIATEIEGHPDNIAPAVVGDMTIALVSGNELYYDKISVPDELIFCAMVPDFRLSTEKSRGVLPEKVSYQDAIYNVSRVALLVSAMNNRRFDLLDEACRDRLHQDYRSPLIANFDKILEKAEELNVFAVFLSGAGPTVMALTDSREKAKELEAYIHTLENNWKMYMLKADKKGAVVMY